MLKRNCGNCGKIIERWNSKRFREVIVPFCNHKCQGEYQRGRNNPMWDGGEIQKECVICEKKYSIKKNKVDKNKTCSKKCHGQLLILRAKDVRICNVCGEEFIVRKASSRMFCSRECADLSHSINMTGTGNPNYINGKGERRHPVEFNKRLKKKIRERDNYTCQICGKDKLSKNLDVHHIDYCKDNNDESNLISLCNVCHSKTNGGRKYWKKELFNLLNVK